MVGVASMSHKVSQKNKRLIFYKDLSGQRVAFLSFNPNHLVVTVYINRRITKDGFSRMSGVKFHPGLPLVRTPDDCRCSTQRSLKCWLAANSFQTVLY